jgi:hypothetical protein
MSNAKTVDFLIVGAPKCATTSVVSALRKHENIYIPNNDEIHFFDKVENWNKGVKWYKNQFGEKEKTIGEATRSYLGSIDAPYRIKKTFPNVKLVCILRDPIKRAHSNYLFSRQHGKFTKSFHESVKEALKKESTPYRLLIHPGLYGWHIKRYLTFFDQKSLLVIKFKDLVQQTTTVLNKIQNHIGVKKKVKKLPHDNKTDQAPKSEIVLNIFRTGRNSAVKEYTKQILGSGIVEFLKKFIMKWGYESMNEKPKIKSETFELLKSTYKSDVKILRDNIDIDTTDWLAR